MSSTNCVKRRLVREADLTGSTQASNDHARFWPRVDMSGGPTSCWPWTGGKSNGYGILRIFGRVDRASRAAWILTNGEIPDELVVCHRCDNPVCCNPSHLFLGTPRDNSDDRDRKGRNAGVFTPLSDDSVVAIAADVRAGVANTEIARKHGVSRTVVSAVRHGLRGSHLTGFSRPGRESLSNLDPGSRCTEKRGLFVSGRRPVSDGLS